MRTCKRVLSGRKNDKRYIQYSPNVYSITVIKPPNYYTVVCDAAAFLLREASQVLEVAFFPLAKLYLSVNLEDSFFNSIELCTILIGSPFVVWERKGSA